MSAATSTSAATSAASSTASSTAKDSDSDDPEGVLFFAYGALMDPAVIQGRLLGREAGLPSRSSSSLSPRAAVAVAFVERGGGGGRRRQRRQKREEQASSSVAVAFAHRGGWATLVDLGDARASAASPLWRLVPGSPRGEEEKEEERGGGWSAREGERGESATAGDTESETSFVGGPCFSSPAHGVLYSLSSESDLEALAEKEGGYSLRKVEVRVVPLGDGGDGDGGDGGGKQTTPLLEAFAFVSSPGLRLRFPLPPRQRYLDKMRRGARAAGLGDEYGAWLDRVPCSGEGGPLDGRYQATPAGAAAAAAGVALFAAVVELLI